MQHICNKYATCVQNYENVQNNYHICEFLFKICKQYASSLQKVCNTQTSLQKYFKSMPEVYQKYATHQQPSLQKLCNKYAKNVQKICKMYATNVQQICSTVCILFAYFSQTADCCLCPTNDHYNVNVALGK